jgi:hypothetical protein
MDSPLPHEKGGGTKHQSEVEPLGEAVLAGVAVEQPDVVLLAVASADREISGVAPSVGGAVGILAAEASEVVHGWEAPGGPGRVGIRG